MSTEAMTYRQCHGDWERENIVNVDMVDSRYDIVTDCVLSNDSRNAAVTKYTTPVCAAMICVPTAILRYS